MYLLDVTKFIVIISIVQSTFTTVFYDDFENGADKWHTSRDQVPELLYIVGANGESSFSLPLNSCQNENVFSLPNFDCTYTNKCLISFDALGVPFQLFATINDKVLVTQINGSLLSDFSSLTHFYNDWVHVEYWYPLKIFSEFGERIVFGSRVSLDDNTCRVSFVDNVKALKIEEKSEPKFPFVILYAILAALIMLTVVGYIIRRLVKSNDVVNPPLLPAGNINKNYEAIYEAGNWNVKKLRHAEMNRDVQLGEGNSATVWLYDWHGIKVAVKSLQVDHELQLDGEYDVCTYHTGDGVIPDENSNERKVVLREHFEKREKWIHNLKWEMFMMNSVQHDNIINVIGYIDSLSSIVLSYMPGKSVYDHMIGNYICPEDKIKIATGVAAALAHLHFHRIIHRDIALRNVLLGEFMFDKKLGYKRITTVVLSDFGLSLGLKPGESVSTACNNYGPIAYMSPESLKGSYSPATDRFMFSNFLWELFKEDTPWRKHQGAMKDEELNIALSSLARKIIGGATPPIDVTWFNYTEFVSIIEQGWSFTPSDRDTMLNVLSKLRLFREHDVPPTPEKRLIEVRAGYTTVFDL